MNDLNTNLRLDLRSGLSAITGARLKGLFLFGSYARGQAEPESDLDVLVVLDRIDQYGAEIDRTGHLASKLSLEHGVTISRVFVSEHDWGGSAEPPFWSMRVQRPWRRDEKGNTVKHMPARDHPS